MSENVKAVIFDFGGVLTLPPTEDHIEGMRQLSGLVRPAFDREYRSRRSDYDSGAIDSAEYWTRVIDSAGAFPESATLEALFEADAAAWTRPNEAVLEWAARLREAGMPTAILSNMPRDILQWIRRRFSWIGSFSPTLFSCELGVNKPQPEIYQACLDALGLCGSEVLFLDDVEENVRGAERAGIRTLLFRSLEDSRSQIADGGWLPKALVKEQV